MSNTVQLTGSAHAGAVALGELGLLIRGAPGSGKSSLAAALLELWRSHGKFARLVADDRALLSAHHGRLVARPAPPIAGLIEVRGSGIEPCPHLAAVRLSAVVDLLPTPARLPDPATVRIGDVALRHLELQERNTAVSSAALWTAFRPEG